MDSDMGESEARPLKRAREKMGEEEMKDSEPKLYICTREMTRDSSARYRLEAIKLSDLLDLVSHSFIEEKRLRLVTYLTGDDEVSEKMGAGAFGSRIVLAGGKFLMPRAALYTVAGGKFIPPTIKIDSEDRHTPTFVLDTHETVPRFIGSRSKTERPSLMIPEMADSSFPWLREINGKLYALTQNNPMFLVFDPETGKWAPLPGLPSDRSLSFYSSYCAVVGTKIFLTLPVRRAELYVVNIFSFDVAHPEKPWTRPKPSEWEFFSCFPEAYNDALVVDLKEEDNSEKLMFTYDYDDRAIIVCRMVLSNEGLPELIHEVRRLPVPSLRSGPFRYRCAHLGGQTVCFSFATRLSLLLFAFEFSYSTVYFDSEPLFTVERSGHHMFNQKSKISSDEVVGLDLPGFFVL